MEATKSGLDMLNRAHGALLRMRENFALITQLCAECQSLIDCHDKIQLLSAVHTNLRKTLQAGGLGGGGGRGRRRCMALGAPGWALRAAGCTWGCGTCQPAQQWAGRAAAAPV